MNGEIGILSVGAGDTKLSFDKTNPAECIRAARIVRDMLRRGYALLIATGHTEDGKPSYQRALDFDDKTYEYIIADFDPMIAAKADETEVPNEQAIEGQADPAGEAATPPGPKRRGRPPSKRVAASSTRAVAVARTSGG